MEVFEVIYKVSLIATLGVLIWYAMETWKIRKINAQQRDLQLLPLPMLYLKHYGGSDRLVVRNIGAGAAIDVRVIPSQFKEESETLSFKYHLVGLNTTLVPQEERGIGINLDINGQENDDPLPNFLIYHNPEIIERRKHKNREIKVQFKDITGQKYSTTISFNSKGISIINPPTRVSNNQRKQ